MSKFKVGQVVWFTLSDNSVYRVKILDIREKKTWYSKTETQYLIKFGFEGKWYDESMFQKIHPKSQLKEDKS